jgi:uncharacterized protein YkwD
LAAVNKFKLVLWFVLSLFAIGKGPMMSHQIPRPYLQFPDAASIEKDLFDMVNQERIERGLDPLKLCDELTRVARNHSRDMASRLELSHISALGNPYQERLVEAGFNFRDIGENVASSETFRADFIHQGFMESSEHRDNILNPDFEAIGIGVVYAPDKKYYVTQDFMCPLKVLGFGEAEKIIREDINGYRSKNSLPPLSFQKMDNILARGFSEKRALGQPLMNTATILGETHIHFITTPELTMPEEIVREVTSEKYERGGVGVWFGRLDDYPGGTYLITIFLFPVDVYESLKEEDLAEILLGIMNEKRKEEGLNPLKLDKKLSREASNVSRRLKKQGPDSDAIPGERTGMVFASYVTEDMRKWPESLEQTLISPGLRKIGIGISCQENDKHPSNKYYITIIFFNGDRLLT